MNSVRLTKDMRATILRRMIEHAFGARAKELDELEKRLAGDIYDDVYPAREQKVMRSLRAGYLPEAEGFSIAFGGQFTAVYWKEERRVADEHTHSRTVRAYAANSPFAERHAEIAKLAMRLKEDKDRAFGAAHSALASCATVRQLVALWPEAAPFVKDFTAPPQQRALALNIAALNRQLGLSDQGEKPR